MKERPILMTTDSVKAILDGRKTMTRRVVKPQPFLGDKFQNYEPQVGKCPYGQVGDRLWVRETWAVEYVYDNHKPRDIPQRARVYYKTQDLRGIAFVGKWRPSLFMPRWASRLTLEITGVRVERLVEITEEDARAEGVAFINKLGYAGWRDYSSDWNEEIINVALRVATSVDSFSSLWDKVNAKRGYGWDTNCWVWVIQFDNIGVRVK